MATIKIKTRPCPMCKETAELEVIESDLARYNHGALIQGAFPEMSKDDRERLISGMCGPCWAALFSGEEDEDDTSYDEPFALSIAEINEAVAAARSHKETAR
jgi:hypothetical protein